MLKKVHNQPKTGNIAKVKYFLPSSSQNRYEPPQNEQSRLNQIKRSINNKYKGSYSTSKNSSKRPSVSKLQHVGHSINSQINLSDDVSFEIVAIKDVQEKTKEFTKSNHQKAYHYPLGDHQTNDVTNSTNFGVTFGSEKVQSKVLESSKALQQLSKTNNFAQMIKNYPKPEEKAEFQRFLEGLKKDENYQNTITMFTMMYFYEQKAKKK